jgi:hypothetical protein
MSNFKAKNQKRLDQFMNRVKICSTCENLRIEVTTEQLPAVMQKDLSFFGAGVTFIYCKKCDEYSILTKPEISS